MASETDTGTLLGSFFAIWADTDLVKALVPHNVTRPFFRNAGRQPSLVHQWGIADDEGAATAAGSITTLDEAGTGLTNTAVSSTTAAATAAVAGMMTTMSDELAAVAPQSVSHVNETLGNALGERYETDMTGLFDDFTNSTGVSGQDATIAQLLEAKIALTNRDVSGEIVAVVHPQQAGDLEVDLATQGASLYGGQNAGAGGLDATGMSGYVAAPHGIPVFRTSTVATANGGADRCGGVFEVNNALGIYEVWSPRIRTERDESGPGEEYVGTGCYGVALIHDARGQEFTTDA